MTDTLRKAMAILIANPTALEELVKAMEACLEGGDGDSSGVDGSGLVEASYEPKHPLEGYEITKKDVGSLVLVSDYREDGYIPEVLRGVSVDCCAEFKTTDDYWEYAKPCLDTIALHFKPFYATEDSVAPDDLGEHYAVLWNNGDIELILNVHNESWTHEELDEFWIIGYRPLKFVNPLGEV